MSFQKRTIITFLLIYMLVSIVSSVISYQLNKRDIEREIQDKYTTVLSITAEDISDDINRLTNISGMVIAYPIINDFIQHMYHQDEMGLSKAWGYELNLQLNQFLTGLMLYDPILSSVGISIRNQYYHYSLSGTTPPLDFSLESSGLEWYSEVISSSQPYVIGMHDSYLLRSSESTYNSDTKRYFSIAQNVRNATTQQPYAILISSFDADQMIQKYTQSLDVQNFEFYIAENTSGRILLTSRLDSNAPDHLDTEIQRFQNMEDNSYILEYGNELCLAVKAPINGMNCNVITVISSIGWIYDPAKRLFFYSVLITASGLLVFLLLSYVNSRHLSKPVGEIISSLKQIGKGDLDLQIDLSDKQDEMAYISKHINKMVVKIRNLIEKLHQEEIAAQKLQFEALQMQINPHFICNTLGSIRLMALLHQQNDIADVLQNFCTILTHTFRSTGSFTTLKQDLELIRAYEQIMMLRYGDIFHIEYQIDPDTEDCKILKFLLQPSVENAILHGILPKQEKGTIWLSSYRKENQLILCVSDNGIGTDKSLTQMEHNSSSSMMGSIGLSNIKRRLELIYKGTASVCFQSVLGKGTTVTFQIPIKSKEVYHENPIDCG
jgi:two-component system sensor histidine kinase YesM